MTAVTASGDRVCSDCPSTIQRAAQTGTDNTNWLSDAQVEEWYGVRDGRERPRDILLAVQLATG